METISSKIDNFLKSLYSSKVNNNIFIPSECLHLKSEKYLKDYQEFIVKYFFESTVDGLLLVYSTGLGKTLVAATIAKCFIDHQETLREDQRGKVIFVEKGCPIVICGSGLLKITDASFVETNLSSQFLPLKKFRTRFI